MTGGSVHGAGMQSVGRWVCVWLAGAFIACSGTDREVVVKRKVKQAQGPVVASVDGDQIALSEVEELVRATQLTPREALSRLEGERLLGAYAAQRGYGEQVMVRDLKQARVRALLASTVEVGNAPEDISMAEVKERFDAVRARQERPETRAVTHVLFKTEPPSSEAKATAAAAAFLRELTAKDANEAMKAAMDAVPAKGDRGGLPVVRESLDARQDGKLEAPFADAAFELPEPGLVPRVVRSSYGFHVILVTGITPATSLQLADYETEIRKVLSQEKREAALTTLIETLKLKDPVQLDEGVVQKALADDSLLGAAP